MRSYCSLLLLNVLLGVKAGDYNSVSCPPVGATCKYQDDVFNLTNQTTPPCWKGDGEDGYDCIPLESDGECNEGYINIVQSCKKIDPPSCPAKDQGNLSCKAHGLISDTTASSPGANICWYKDDNDSWKCLPTIDNNECGEGQLDITTCKFDEQKDEAPKCPPKDKPSTQCTGDNGKTYTLFRPGKFHCWTFKEDKWSCTSKSFGTCDKNALDISTCEVENPAPSCPEEKYYNLRCKNVKSGETYIAGSPQEYVCWAKNRKQSNEWGCTKKSDNGECKDSQLDISACTFSKPKEPCLPRESKCTYKNKEYTIFDPTAPKCWKKTDYGYECYLRKEKEVLCPSGFTDVKVCYPKCPKQTATCDTINDTYSPLRALSSLDPEALCWDPSNGNDDPLSFNCFNKIKGICPLGSADISQCGAKY
ncbi:hypothetical protein K502DRAFT_355608 [Neoconidiobolus thromboides FSU 785]|nr:hypothetical protein K502DRAFT_355608 [Neoconidiobolus thromboides FSU 785]